jgi:2-dehydro-3-deoxyphosphogluconate aldolase/(4S)-4-hydroxy-2-oxoglutarate aldolase
MGKQYTMEQIGESRVIAVLVIDRVEDAVPLAKALIDGGVNAMELTLRTDAAIDSLRAIIAEVPEMIAGIGTILTVNQLREVCLTGAAFGVAPGLNRKVADPWDCLLPRGWLHRPMWKRRWNMICGY